jgi:hypothetical protein
MKIKTQELKELLNLEEKDLKKLTLEQLRLLLGVSHYLARLTQREINERN